MVMSGRSNGSLVGRTCVANWVVSLSMISVVANSSRFCSAGISLPVSGNDVTRLPPTLMRARMLPASTSSGSTAHGHSLMNACASGMEPGPARSVHRAGENHQYPRKPLGDVGPDGRHGDTCPGFDRDARCATHRIAQTQQVGFSYVREHSGVLQ